LPGVLQNRQSLAFAPEDLALKPRQALLKRLNAVAWERTTSNHCAGDGLSISASLGTAVVVVLDIGRP
jgi:hypothetical protein